MNWSTNAECGIRLTRSIVVMTVLVISEASGQFGSGVVRAQAERQDKGVVNLPKQAQSLELYWTTVFGKTIMRAGLRCPVPMTILSTPGPTRGIALDEAARYVYWTSAQPSGIYRARFDGSQTELLIGECGPAGICGYNNVALDLRAQKMYWTESGPPLHYHLRRANLDGSDPQDVIQNSELTAPSGLAIHHGQQKLYWTEGGLEGKIRRANLDGTEIEDLAEIGLNAFGFALDEHQGKMYWTSNWEGEVWRANLDGTHTQLIASDHDNPLGLALDLKSRKVYWADHHAGLVYRANLNGSHPKVVLTTRRFQVLGVALRQSFCAGDFDNDGLVDQDDYISLLSMWGDCSMCPQDLNCDGDVDRRDLRKLLMAFGSCD